MTDQRPIPPEDLVPARRAELARREAGENVVDQQTIASAGAQAKAPPAGQQQATDA